MHAHIWTLIFGAWHCIYTFCVCMHTFQVWDKENPTFSAELYKLRWITPNVSGRFTFPTFLCGKFRNSKVLFSGMLPVLKSVHSVHSVHTGLPPMSVRNRPTPKACSPSFQFQNLEFWSYQSLPKECGYYGNRIPVRLLRQNSFGTASGTSIRGMFFQRTSRPARHGVEEDSKSI